MPKISESCGISTYMYYREHGNGRGKFSPRALGLVTDWASQHQKELARNWERARTHEPLDKIEPLELE